MKNSREISTHDKHSDATRRENTSNPSDHSARNQSLIGLGLHPHEFEHMQHRQSDQQGRDGESSNSGRKHPEMSEQLKQMRIERSYVKDPAHLLDQFYTRSAFESSHLASKSVPSSHDVGILASEHEATTGSSTSKNSAESLGSAVTQSRDSANYGMQSHDDTSQTRSQKEEQLNQMELKSHLKGINPKWEMLRKDKQLLREDLNNIQNVREKIDQVKQWHLAQRKRLFGSK